MAAKKDMRGSSKIFDLAHNDHEGFAKAIAAARQDFQVKWWWKYGQPKIDFIRADLKISRLTATRYLDALAEGGFLNEHKIGRHSYYINQPLFRILTEDVAR